MKYILHGLKKYETPISGTPLYFEMGSINYPFSYPQDTGVSVAQLWSTVDVGIDLYYNGGFFYLPYMGHIKDNNSLANYFPLGFEYISGRYRKDINFSLTELNGDFITSYTNTFLPSVPSEINWSVYGAQHRFQPIAYTGSNYLPLSDISVNLNGVSLNVGDIISYPPTRYNPPTVSGITTFTPTFKAYTDSDCSNEGTSQFENGFEVFNYPNAASNETHIRFKPCKYRQYYKIEVVDYIDAINIVCESYQNNYIVTNIEKIYSRHSASIFTIYGID